MKPEDTFTLNIDRCIADKSNPAVIRELFKQLRDDGYINVGKYFAEMSDIDLDMLTEIADHTHPDAVGESTPEQITQSMETMALMGMALTVGEGGVLSESACEQGLKLTITYIAIESLYRRGIVNVFRENWSMTEEGNKPIVEMRK
jgi:hypothetical protein